MKKDAKVIDFTKIQEQADYVITALMPTPQKKMELCYVHYGMNETTNKEDFYLENEFEGCCIFDKKNAEGVAEIFKKALLGIDINVREVEYVKKKKKYKFV
jgi:hypothetical protein